MDKNTVEILHFTSKFTFVIAITLFISGGLMKIRLALFALLLPAFIFAQSAQNGQGNAGYQGTMNGSKGGAMGAPAPSGVNQSNQNNSNGVYPIGTAIKNQ